MANSRAWGKIISEDEGKKYNLKKCQLEIKDLVCDGCKIRFLSTE